MMIKKSNKKASGDSAIVWVALFFALAFFLASYLFAVSFLAQKKNMFEKSSFEITRGSQYDYSLSESFLNFLNSDADFNGRTIKVKDLLETDGSDNLKLEKFKKYADGFLSQNIFPEGTPIEKTGNYQSAYIEVYDKEDDITNYLSSKYLKYSANRKKPSGGFTATTDCNPTDTLSTVVVSIVPPNKKIVFCVQYEN